MNKKKITEAKDIHVSGDFIAGDQFNYYYSGDFASLAEYYISPEPVFQRVRTDDFIGRDWLTAKVDAFLNDPNRKSGAFLLIGDAGVGKTSFMAHLVKERRYLHLFAEQAPGQAMLQRAMQSLGSQLVTRYQIDPYKDRDTLNALSVFPDFLERILRLAANALTEGEKIVIICDALDEAGTFPDHFVFGLPKELPDGVYFILSQRPVNVKLPNFEPVIEKLEAQGEGNLQDIEAYLSAVAKRPEVAGQIRSKEYSEEFFIQTLKEKSQGVWMYLHYVIKEIESGARAPLDLANLPTGLVGYYAEYWDAWRTGKRGKGEEAWDELYAPLLTTLAAAQEAIPVDWLIQWADVTAKPHEVTRLLTEHWRAFLTEKEVNGKKAYTPYHLSFKDFITGRVDTNNLQPVQANLVKDLAAQTVDAHKRIVVVFEKECNGKWEKLVEQDYPRLHLTAHLSGAKEYEKLRMLLTEGDENIKWADAREKKEETYAGYLNDLTYIWDYAKQEQNYALAIRCMLIENSIHSLAANIPPELLAELAKAGIWSYARCLSTIQEKTDPHAQAESLKLILLNCPPSLYLEAYAVARKIKSEYSRAVALSALAPHLTEEIKAHVLSDALAAARKIKDESARADVLSVLIPCLTEELKAQAHQETLVAVREIKHKYFRVGKFLKIARHLNDEPRTQIIAETLATAREINDELAQALALSALVPYLNDELKAQVLAEALAAARAIKDESPHTLALSYIAPHLNDELKAPVLAEALAATSVIKHESTRSFVLSYLIPHLNDEQKAQALTTACEIKDESTRFRTLSDLIPHLNYEQKAHALTTACEVKDEPTHSRTLLDIIPHLNDEQKAKVLAESLAVASKIIDGSARAFALSALVPHLNDKLKAQVLAEAVTATLKVKDESSRAFAFSALVPHLNDDLKAQALAGTIAAAREIIDGYTRARALSYLIPYLNDEQKAQVLAEALAISFEIIDGYARARALSCLIPYLNDEQKAQAITAAYEFKDESIRSFASSLLIPYLNDEQKAQAITAAYEFKDESTRSRTLSGVIPHLNGELKIRALAEALAAARIIKDESTRSRTLSYLIPHLNEEQKAQVLAEALAVVREIMDKDDNTFALSALVPHLNDELKAQVLAETFIATIEIKDESTRAFALSYLIPLLNDEQKAQALAVTIEIKNESVRSLSFSYLIPHLSDVQKVQVLAAMRTIKDESSRVQSLTSLVFSLDAEIAFQVLQDILDSSDVRFYDNALAVLKRIKYKHLKEHIIPFVKFISQKDRYTGIQVIGYLTPALVHFRGPEIADELYRTITDVTRWWP